MHDDFKELLSAFNAHRVRYLVVGGWAVSEHAEPRATKDLDVFIEPTLRNGAAVYRALVEFGAPIGHVSAADLVEPGTFYRMGRPPFAIDILPQISGVSFPEVWKNRVRITIDRARRLKANFISAEDLITAKLAAGRSRDLRDVEDIRRAQALRAPKVRRKKPATPRKARLKRSR